MDEQLEINSLNEYRLYLKNVSQCKVIKNDEYCANILDLFCGLHDYCIEKIDYDAHRDKVNIYLSYDTGEEGVILQFRDVQNLRINPRDSFEKWIPGATIKLLEDGSVLWYDDDISATLDQLRYNESLTWVIAKDMLFAYTDGDFSIRPIMEKKLNPVWHELNYKTGKYVDRQLHFEVYEIKEISLPEAARIATDCNKKYDAVQEFSDGYSFFIDDGIQRDGGPDNGIIVLKEEGRIIPLAEYFMSGKYEADQVGEKKKLKDLLNEE